MYEKFVLLIEYEYSEDIPGKTSSVINGESISVYSVTNVKLK